MRAMAMSRVTGTDGEGRAHTVRVAGAGSRRRLECDSCEWRRPAQFLAWLKAQEHLSEAHGAVVPLEGGGS
ncbi:hypothetical protein ACFQLX_11510 [Streptomyces polyrhachis]|uniref:Uncharacterized protein n=1 Tax=Streptomyces polyrhachis TaxID=1282885 RepID=A0ABW2GGL7_9ACTN